MMKSKHVADVFEIFRKLGSSSGGIGSIHHVVELLVSLYVLLVPLDASKLLSKALLAMLRHEILLQCVTFLLIVNVVQVLDKHVKRVNLSELLTLEVCGLS